MNQNFLASLTGGYLAGQKAQRNVFDMRQEQTERKEAMLQRVARGVVNSPDPARAWGPALQAVQQAGYSIEGLPQEYNQQADLLARMYAADPVDRTEFERLAETLTPDEFQKAARIKLGLEPDADTVFTAENRAPARPPTGYRYTNDGQLEFVPGGPADPEVKAAQRGNGITIGPDGTVQIGGNPQGQLGRSARNQEEKALATETNLLSRMSGLGELVGIGPDGRMSPEARDMLTYQSQAEDWFTRQAEKLGVEPSEVQRQAVGRRAQFNTTVEQLFNAYRQEITGAAAAVQELERLKKSFINIDMSPSQFEAAYAQFMGELQRSMRVRNKLIRQGFDPSTQQGGETFDREFLLGGDDDPAQRFAELMAGGLSEDDAYARMIEEGY